MKCLQRFLCVSLTLALVALGVWGPAAASAGPIIKQRVESELELDLGMIVEDFTPSLIELAGIEDETAPEKIRALLSVLGISALDRLDLRTSLNDERGLTSVTVTLDPSADGGLLADLFAVPQGEFRFGRYLDDDDVVLVVFAAGLVERIRALENLFSRPEVRELAPMVPSEPLSITAMWGVNVEKDVFPLLTGELDLIVLPCAEGQECEMPALALVLGLTDGAAFRELLLNTLSNILGPEQGAALRGAEGETAGDFTFYPLDDDVAYAIGPDFGIVTTDPGRLKSVVEGRGRGSSSIKASSYVRVNADLLVTMAAGLAEMAGAESPEAAIVADVLRAMGEESVGAIELTGRTGGDRFELEVRAPASLYTTQYLFLKELVAAMPALAAAEAKNAGADLPGVVGQVDGVLTRYGREHEGTFPEDLEQLVEEGYLDSMIQLQPTPLGEYVDGGFTYLALQDESGKIVGYYFFVYGGDPQAGYDVFTPAALSDPAGYRAAKDGEPDGVVGFSYDGIAIEHVDEWSRDGE